MSDHYLDLQRRWTTRLAALLDQTLEDDPLADLPLVDLPLVDAVAATWRRLADEQPAVRAELDAVTDRSPELSAAMDQEYWTLAVAANLADLTDPREQAVRIGRTYLAMLRDQRPAAVGKIA